MPSLSFHLLLLISLTAVAIPTRISATKIGVTYSTPASALISPEEIVAKVVSMKYQEVRLLDPNPEMIRAFADTNVALFLSVPNPMVPLLASNHSLALDWVANHVLPFHPRTKISIISIGNDMISPDSPDAPPLFLLRGMKNVHRSLALLKIYNISVSTTFSFSSIIAKPFPPSSAQFHKPNGEVMLRPILQFLERTNSSFLINLHPYHIYESRFATPTEFALFGKPPFSFREDLASPRARYDNLFDMMVDAVIRSMAVTGHENVPVIVAETGWPSSAINASEVDATLKYSETFLKALIAHLRRGRGTPLRKEGVSEVYIFELVDKEAKQGLRNWGVLHHDLTNKYSSDLLGDDDVIKIILSVVAVNLTVILGVASCVYIIYYCFERRLRRNSPPRPTRKLRRE